MNMCSRCTGPSPNSSQLEQSPEHAAVISAQLIRHATAMHMIYNMLPSGRSVTYQSEGDEDVPTIPMGDALEPASAITASTDAIAEEGKAEEAARQFAGAVCSRHTRILLLSQWVAFDDNDNLLVNSISEAEAHIASMQKFLTVIFTSTFAGSVYGGG